MNNKPFFKFTKTTLILFIVFNFISIVSLAKIKNIHTAVFFNSVVKSKTSKRFDKTIISGTIKSDDGRLLENAKIIFDSTEVASTDKDGKFSFEPGDIVPGRHTIYFSCDSFVTVVRTYYSIMLSSDYDIILRKQFDVGKQAASLPFHVVSKDSIHTIIVEPIHSITKDTVVAVSKDSVHTIIAGPIHRITKDTVITISKDSSFTTIKEPTPAKVITTEDLDFPSILFKANSNALNAENKAFLDIISQKLKNNPTVKVDIKAYTPEHDYDPILTQKRLANTVRFLTEKGIAADRLNKVTVAGGGEVNTIDFVISKEQ